MNKGPSRTPPLILACARAGWQALFLDKVKHVGQRSTEQPDLNSYVQVETYGHPGRRPGSESWILKQLLATMALELYCAR